MNLRSLARAIKANLDLPPHKNVVGVSRNATKWERPPLHTKLKLAGIPLDQFLEIESDVTADEVRAVYEEFVHGYLVDKVTLDTPPAKWIQNRLRINTRDVNWIFPVPSKLVKSDQDVGEALVTFLWIAHRAVPGSTLLATPDGVTLVISETVTIGFKEGEVLSRFAKGLKAPEFDHQGFPTRFQASGPRHSKSNALNSAHRLGSRESPELNMALRILYWRASRPDYAESSIFNTSKHEASKLHEIKLAIRDIRDTIHTSKDPREHIKRALVPKFIDSRLFLQLFGNPYRKGTPKPETIDALMSTLIQLPELI